MPMTVAIKRCAAQFSFFIAPLILCHPVTAAEVTWSGFMSVVGGTTLDSGTTYDISNLTESGASTYRDRIEFSPDSIFGLQGQFLITDQLRGTIQLAANGYDDYGAHVRWAYLSYTVNDALTVNAGRFRMPAYFYTDYADVGYAYYWIRPPIEIYGASFSLDGVSLLYNTYVGDYDVTSQAWYGNSSFELDGADVDLTKIRGANVVVGRNGIKARAVYLWLDTEARGEAVIPGVGTFPYYNRDASEYRAVGLTADLDPFLFRTEYTQTKAGREAEFTDIWYVSAGYIIDAITPHITYSEGEEDVAQSKLDRNTTTLGVAWDFHPGAKLKVEYLLNEVDGMDDTKLIAAGIDAVF